MFFTAPIWLIGVVAWAAVATLLLLGRRPRRDVPFLPLWRELVPPRPSRLRRFARPPAAVVLALLAALAAIVAAAGPAVRRPGGGGELVVVVDNGVTMSARAGRDIGGNGGTADGGAGNVRRFDRACVDVAAALVAAGRTEPVTVVDAPRMGRARVAVADLTAYVSGLPGQATDSREAVARAVRRESADPTAGTVLVLTDGPIPVGDPRVDRVAPAMAGRSLGIRAFALRRTPRPQAMVRLSTETWGQAASDPAPSAGRPALPTSVLVRVTVDGVSIDRRAPTPPRGTPVDLFVDLPESQPETGISTSVATASLVGWDDDLAADDRADLTVAADWPMLEPAGPLGDLQRLVDVYRRLRPTGERSVRVVIATDLARLGGSAGVVLPAPTAAVEPTRASVVVPHPITGTVADWTSIELPAVADRGPPDGFTTVLSDRRGPLVAVRQSGGAVGPAFRQAWMAVGSGGWAGRPEYVAFFSALFDWVGQTDAGVTEFGRRSLSELTNDWLPADLAPASGPVSAWPGVYRRRGDGVLQAFGPAEIGRATGIAIAAPGGVNGNGKIESADVERARWLAALAAGDRVLSGSPWLLVVGLALAAGSAACWPRREGAARMSPIARARPGISRPAMRGGREDSAGPSRPA